MERWIARCLSIRCARTGYRCPASWALPMDSQSMLQYLPHVDTHEQPGYAHFSTFARAIFFSHCGSRADDPSSNSSRLDKVFLYGMKHIAKSAACLRMTKPGSMGGWGLDGCTTCLTKTPSRICLPQDSFSSFPSVAGRDSPGAGIGLLTRLPEKGVAVRTMSDYE